MSVQLKTCRHRKTIEHNKHRCESELMFGRTKPLIVSDADCDRCLDHVRDHAPLTIGIASIKSNREPLPTIKTPCKFEGAVVEWCTKCGADGEANHVRICWHNEHDRCTRENKKRIIPGEIDCCAVCPDRVPTAPAPWPMRLDETTLPAPGMRINAAITSFGKTGYALAYRSSTKGGSDIYLGTLDSAFKPDREFSKLDLDHPDAPLSREDPRLFWHNGHMHTQFAGVSRNANGIYTNVLYARLRDDLTVDRVFAPQFAWRNLWEKNWQPFTWDGNLFAVYTISPHRVLILNGDAAEMAYATPNHAKWLPANNKWGYEMRGSAPPVLVGDEYWSFFHDKHKDVYRTGLYTFEAKPPFRPRRMIRDPIMVADRSTWKREYYVIPVIFTVGAVRVGDDWILSSGVHERWSELHRFAHADLERRLVSV